MKIGVFGLGNMGGTIARKLKSEGSEVYGYDSLENVSESRLKEGAISRILKSEDIPELDIFILSLPSKKSISDTLERFKFREGSIIMDMSTVDVDFSVDNRKMMAERGVIYVDTPVIGMPSGVGTWTIPVGSDEKTFEKVKGVLKPLANLVEHAGASGSGSAIKVLNNMISLSTWATISEAVAIADKLGIDLGKMYRTIKASGGGAVSPMLDRIERIVNDDYRNICSVDVNIKDLEAAMNLSMSTKIPSLMAAASLNLHLMAHDRGYGNMDMDAIVLTYEDFKKKRGK